jgi:hypothetical protein
MDGITTLKTPRSVDMLHPSRRCDTLWSVNERRFAFFLKEFITLMASNGMLRNLEPYGATITMMVAKSHSVPVQNRYVSRLRFLAISMDPQRCELYCQGTSCWCRHRMPELALLPTWQLLRERCHASVVRYLTVM